LGSTLSRRAPSWHERERTPEPGPHLEAGGTIENARVWRRTKAPHHQTLRSHRRRAPFDEVERITNLIPAPPPHNLSVELQARCDDSNALLPLQFIVFPRFL